MVMNSGQISGMVGGFNSQVMQGMQHSAMISQQFGGYTPMPQYQPTPTQGQQFGGMAMQAMGNMGMSAMGSSHANNFGGGVMSPAMSAGQFGLGQVQYGAQQQQMLDSNLRQSFRHQNEMGGRGFSANQMAGIGADLRSQSMQRGPGGEQTSFDELGRLASNMGRMGMAEGVRGVKDFNEKFREMLSTVKTVATELSTSLEEAQKVMAAVKGSGVFKNQAQFAGKIRAGATAGGLATSELSGMALIGSQISRSVGGTGAAGAGAGVESMTQLGSAIKAGVINEEDIYNSTGLSGAAGRRAFAQQGLGHEAQFYKGGLGRRMLASIAGKDGEIDEDSLQELMSGGGGTAGTMARASKNLSGIGRANFVRNEGRLRGAAMEKMGMLGSAIQARDWMSERGMDINEDDDRSMLFFQRKFGMGRDQADSTIKMARNLDRIGLQRKSANQQDKYAREIERDSRMESGTELFKRAEMGRTSVQNTLRQVGADMYGDLSTGIGEMMGQATGKSIDRRRASLVGSVDQVYEGGGQAAELLERQFGISRGTGGKLQTRMLGGGFRDLDASEGESGQTAKQFTSFIGGQGEKLRGAGIDPSDIRTASDYAAAKQGLHGNQMAFERGRGQTLDLDSSTRAELMRGGGLGGGSEKDFLKSVGESLEKLSDTQGKALAEKFGQASEKEQARIAGQLTTALGLSGAGKFKGSGQLSGGSVVTGTSATLAHENRSLGDSILQGGLNGNKYEGFSDDFQNFAGDASRVLGGEHSGAGRFIASHTGKGSMLGDLVSGADDMLGGIVRDRKKHAATIAGAPRSALEAGTGLAGDVLSKLSGGRSRGWSEDLFGKGGATGALNRGLDAVGFGSLEEGAADSVEGALGGSTGKDKEAVGEFLKSDRGRRVMQGLASDDPRERSKTQQNLLERISELGSKDKLNHAEEAEMKTGRMLEAMAQVSADPSSLEAVAAGLKMTTKQFKGARDKIESEYSDQIKANRQQMFKSVGERAMEQQITAQRNKPDVDKLVKEKKLGGPAQKYLADMATAREKQAMITGENLEMDAGLLGESQELIKGAQGSLDDMDNEQRMGLASALGAQGEKGQAARIRREVSIGKRLEKAGKRGSEKESRSIAGMLGASFKKGEMGGSGQERLDNLMGQLGIDDMENSGAMADELKGILSGNKFNKDGEVTGKMTARERESAIASFQEREELGEGRKKKQDSESAESDPSYRVLVKMEAHMKNSDDKMGRMLGSLATANEHLAKSGNPESEEGK